MKNNQIRYIHLCTAIYLSLSIGSDHKCDLGASVFILLFTFDVWMSVNLIDACFYFSLLIEEN